MALLAANQMMVIMSKLVRPPGLPTDVYRDVVTELLDGWDRIATSYEVRGTDISAARIVFATTAAAYRQALAAHTLWKGDLWHESGPNVRYCFQAAIAAAWTQQTGHAGVEAAAYEFTQQNRRLVESADKAALTIADQARADIVAAVP